MSFASFNFFVLILGYIALFFIAIAIGFFAWIILKGMYVDRKMEKEQEMHQQQKEQEEKQKQLITKEALKETPQQTQQQTQQLKN